MPESIKDNRYVSGKDILLSFFLYSKKLTCLSIVVTIISALAEILFPWFLQQGIDAVTGERTEYTLSSATLSMLITVIVIALGQAGSLSLESRLFAEATYKLRRRIYSSLETMEMSSLQKHRSGTLAFRATNDVSNLFNNLSEFYGEFSFDLLVSLGALSAMLSTDKALTIAVLLVMISSAFLSDRSGSRLPIYKRANQMLSSKLAGNLQESLSKAKIIKSLGAEQLEIGKMDIPNRMIMGIDLKSGFTKAIVSPLWHLADSLGMIVVLFLGGMLLMQHRISVGNFVAFIAYQQLLSGPISHFGNNYYLFLTSKALADRLSTLLNYCNNEDLAESLDEPKTENEVKTGDLRISDLAFSYPGSDRTILAKVNLEIKAGEKIGIIGPNGAGKSSFFDLLMGFYPPTEGNLTYDNQNITQLGISRWRKIFGLMPQETLLFKGSLQENLVIAKASAGPEELLASLEIAGASVLLNKLANGIDTQIDEGGQNLSGGEKQLIGLTRLILRNSPVILLDEPTAHVDIKATAEIKKIIQENFRDRTILLITHDLDMLDIVDRIIVIDEGEIMADGSAGQLESLCRKYTKSNS